MLSGFVRPSSGSVKIDGQDLAGIKPHKRAAFGIRRTFQNEQVVENLTLEQLAAVLDNLPTDGRRAKRSHRRGARFCQPAPSGRAHRRDLNAFERRLVEIARATVAKPRLVMMDEPGAGLSRGGNDHLRQVIVAFPIFAARRFAGRP